MAPGARSKSGAPMFEPEVFRKQTYCFEESTCDIVGTFRRLPQSFGPPAVIWRPENCAPLVLPRYAAAPMIYTNCIDSHSRVEDQPLSFSDDLVPLASSQQGLQYTLDQFSAGCDRARMKISIKTTEVLCLSTNQRQCMLQVSGIHCSRWRNSST